MSERARVFRARFSLGGLAGVRAPNDAAGQVALQGVAAPGLPAIFVERATDDVARDILCRRRAVAGDQHHVARLIRMTRESGPEAQFAVDPDAFELVGGHWRLRACWHGEYHELRLGWSECCLDGWI